jgi:hypothetical protein
MFNSVLQNREAINLMSQSNADFPLFTPTMWALVEALVDSLAPLHGATLQIQNRRCSISSFIPFCKLIMKSYPIAAPPLSKKVVDLKVFRQTVATELKLRLSHWEEKRLLIIYIYKQKYIYLDIT